MTNALEPRKLLKIVEQSHNLAFDYAMALEGKLEGVALADVLSGYGLFEADIPRLMELPAFERRVTQLRTDIREHGLSFRSKAAALAEEFLPTVAGIVRDTEVNPQVRLNGATQLAKWGGLEKPPDAEGKQGMTLVINLGGDTPSRVIEVTSEPGADG